LGGGCVVNEALHVVRMAIVPALVLAAACGGAGYATRSRRPGHTTAVSWTALFCAAGLVLGVTLFRDGIPHTVLPQALTQWPMDQTQQVLSDPFASTQVLLNVLLYAPVGLLLARVTGRPLMSWGALAVASLLVEMLQALLGAGANDLSDVAANAVGAAVGTACAALLVWARPGAAERSSRRHMVEWAGGWAAGLALTVGTAHLLAQQRADQLRGTLAETFRGTTLTDYQRWQTGDLLEQRVFAAVTPRADASDSTANAVTVRYPASVLGVHRCVLVTWRAAGVSIAVDAGSPCTRLPS